MSSSDLIIPGFKAAAVKAGIRGKDRLDMALIYSEKPAAAAGVFTTSQVKAAPVLLDMEHLQGHSAQAILINSGVANACSGSSFFRVSLKSSTRVARIVYLPSLISDPGWSYRWGSWLPGSSNRLVRVVRYYTLVTASIALGTW